MTDISHHLPSEPQPWAVEAASLPLAFAQVREDPRLDLEFARTLPSGASVAMIASGGETALCLARLPLGRLHLVDMNPAQLALTRLKWRLATSATSDEAAALLGHLPMPATERHRVLQAHLHALSLDPSTFGPPEFVSLHGPDHSGRYERAFARLRHLLSPQRAAWDALLNTSEPIITSPLLAPGTPLGIALDSAFAEAFSLANLVRLFGVEATRNPLRPFHEHFASRTRLTLSRHPASTNPFLWQIFAGTFPPAHRYDWLQQPAPLLAYPVYYHGKMASVLESMPRASMDLVHLSNILDWLSPQEAEATLRTAAHALKPGGRVIIRQLNSTLDIASLGSAFTWDHTLAAGMESRDRSFFYPRLFIGARA